MIETAKTIVKKAKGFRKWMKYKDQIQPVTYEGTVPFEDWKELFRKYIIDTGYRWGECTNILEFCNVTLERVREGAFENTKDAPEPILVCVEKNDLNRMRQLLDHYRKLGVEKFVIVDNMSTDGTVEYLKNQAGVDIWLATEKYTSTRRQAWVNRVLSWYGYNRWYLVVDSDEYCVYPDCETRSIPEMVRYCKEHGYKTVRGVMLDMYAKADVSQLDEVENFREVCCYFDGDGYYEEPNRFFRVIRGGMRERVMHTPVLLTKYPLFCYEKGVFEESAHYRTTYPQNLNVPCLFGILHYKFTNKTDLDKIRQRVKEGNYYRGSAQYSEYLKSYEKTALNLYYEGSVPYQNSQSLKQVTLFDDWKN